MRDLSLAREIFERDGLAFVIIHEGREIGRGRRQGIRELLEAFLTCGEDARGASLADKVVGKAVALAATAFGIREIYSPLASEHAVRVCRARGNLFHFERVVPYITNAEGDGLCPLERLTLEIDDPLRALDLLCEFVKLPRQASGAGSDAAYAPLNSSQLLGE